MARLRADRPCAQQSNWPGQQQSGWASRQWRLSLILQLLHVLLLLALPIGALATDDVKQAATDDALFSAHLESGEFGLAQQQIEKSKGPARNARLAQLAAAQARVGARDAAIATVAQLDDDLERNTVLAQIGAFPGQGGRVPFAAGIAGPGGGANGNPGAAPGALPGAQGGGTVADFESLMDLITSTIAPTTWEDVGGNGAIESYRNGVFVDGEGVLRRATKTNARADLVTLRREAAVSAGPQDVRQSSKLRKVSISRLERVMQLKHAAGRPTSDIERTLAGLQRIDYVLAYPETGDLVIAGPAGGWQFDAEGRAVSDTTGRPCLRLDDLVVLWRHSLEQGHDVLGCTINPSAEGLAAAQAYLDAKQAKPAGRKQQLEQLRRHVGLQTIEVFGIDGHTTAARTLVAGDYHMKLIGMGLAPGVPGVPSYLELVARQDEGAAPALDVLRWWFTLACDAVESDAAREAFALRGVAVKLQGENEFLNATGRRVATGEADELNRKFAANFNDHYSDLAAKYPVYAELENLFALELCGALVASQQLAERVHWHRTYFGPAGSYLPEAAEVPRSVETVSASQKAGKRRVVAGVSGGIHADPWSHVSEAALVDGDARLKPTRQQAAPLAPTADRWWWD